MGPPAPPRAEGLTVLEVEEVNDFPEMLEGRVKTFASQRSTGGILARRNRADEMAALERFGKRDSAHRFYWR